MERYFIFAYDAYYPSGGMHDYVAARDNLEEAIQRAKEEDREFVEIYDMITKEKVWENR